MEPQQEMAWVSRKEGPQLSSALLNLQSTVHAQKTVPEGANTASQDFTQSCTTSMDRPLGKSLSPSV